MKKIAIILCLLPIFAASQNFYFSVRGGLTGYNGDLKKNTVSLLGLKPLGSIGVRYDLSEHITLRSYITLTSLKADDKKGTPKMQTRNLNFKSKILDWEGGVQYNFLSLNSSWWSPYVYAGIGLYHFKPYTNDFSGKKVFLNPLSTEGQGFTAGVKNYKLTQFSVPVGIGVDRALNEDIKVGFEMGYRILFTDYLDDVSGMYVDESALLAARGQQAVDLAYRGYEVGAGPYPAAGQIRGNPDHKDGYFYMALTFTFRHSFDKYKRLNGLPSARKEKRVGCPSTRYIR